MGTSGANHKRNKQMKQDGDEMVSERGGRAATKRKMEKKGLVKIENWKLGGENDFFLKIIFKKRPHGLKLIHFQK